MLLPDTCLYASFTASRISSTALCPRPDITPSASPGSLLLVRKPKYRIGQPALETLVIHELFEQLGVVLHHRGHHTQQRLVVLNAGILSVRVLLGVLEGRVLSHPGRNGLGNELPHTVGVVPVDVAEEIVEDTAGYSTEDPTQVRAAARRRWSVPARPRRPRRAG